VLSIDLRGLSDDWWSVDLDTDITALGLDFGFGGSGDLSGTTIDNIVFYEDA